MMKPIGTVSVDTDSLESYYYSYTNSSYDEKDITYRRILPRLIEFFRKYNVKATFFIIGKHIKGTYHKNLLKHLVKEGHELANHSFSHPANFAGTSLREKEDEIVNCEKAIYNAAGVKTIGFRAPDWSIDNETMSMLEKHGYRYDSSVYPGFYYPLTRLYFFMKNPGMASFRRLNLSSLFAKRAPYNPGSRNLYRAGKMAILEIPVSCLPVAGFPFHSTILLMTKSEKLFDFSLKSLYDSGRQINYIFHAVDFLDDKNDAIDRRFFGIPHPVNSISYHKRRLMLEKAFIKMAELYELRPINALPGLKK